MVKSMRWWTKIGRSPRKVAPRQMPVMALSDSGMSKARSAPNSSASPSVVPKMPLTSGTPMPVTKTRASLRMTSTVAARTASLNFIVGGLPGRFGPGRRARVGQGLLDLAGHRDANRAILLVGDELPHALDGAAALPRRQLLGRAETLRHVVVGSAVLEPAVGAALDQCRALAAARAVHGRRGRAMNRKGVVAVHDHARNAVCLRPTVDLHGRLALLERREGGPEVVLAEEDHRQPLEHGEVEALVPGAFLDGAVAEDRHRDLGAPEHLVGQRAAHGVGD